MGTLGGDRGDECRDEKGGEWVPWVGVGGGGTSAGMKRTEKRYQAHNVYNRRECAASVILSANGKTFKSSRIRTMNRSPVSCIFSVRWLAGDVKKPTHSSVGHVVPGVVVWPCFTGLCFT